MSCFVILLLSRDRFPRHNLASDGWRCMFRDVSTDVISIIGSSYVNFNGISFIVVQNASRKQPCCSDCMAFYATVTPYTVEGRFGASLETTSNIKPQ